VALHALGLGFTFSMVIGHAPVIVPALAGVRLRFGAWFYAPLLLLHASLACRLFGAIANPEWRTLGAQLNAGRDRSVRCDRCRLGTRVAAARRAPRPRARPRAASAADLTRINAVRSGVPSIGAFHMNLPQQRNRS
jgi:hypothetical protein